MADGFRSPLAGATIDLRDARLSDVSQLAKWRVWEDVAHVALGRAVRDGETLVLAVSPGEWLVVGAEPAVPSVELTHVRAAFRLTGPGAAAILEHVCALDLGDLMTPDGAAARTLVAGVATELIRDDDGNQPSYLLMMSRSFARSVWERLAAAGGGAAQEI